MSALFLLCAISAIAGPVGSTSSWGIVISPCAWCGRSNGDIQVHHKIPQAECKRIGRPDLIYDTNNMVCLCRTGGKGCHFYIGHHGKSWSYVFTNIDAVLSSTSPTSQPAPKSVSKKPVLDWLKTQCDIMSQFRRH